MGDVRSAYKILFGKPEGTTPLWRPRHRRENDGWDGFNWLRI